MKNPMTPAGIKPATFRFVPQHPAYKTTGIITEFVPSRRHHKHKVIIFDGRLTKFQNVQIPNESQFHKIPSERFSSITAKN